jgi:serine/threonine protein kinase
VKAIKPTEFNSPRFVSEVEALVKLNHPCILRIIGWSSPANGLPATIQTEYAANGSLQKILSGLRPNGPVPDFWTDTARAIIIAGIVLGMRHIHSKRFIHGDLKPANILLNHDGYALIGDFGASRLQGADQGTPVAGTVYYAAPEMFLEGHSPDHRADVFAFGLIFHEIITGMPVFSPEVSPLPTMKKILAGKMPTISKEYGALAQQWMLRCCARDPDARPSFNRLLRELQAAECDIVPGANNILVREYVTRVLEWETEAETSLEQGREA